LDLLHLQKSDACIAQGSWQNPIPYRQVQLVPVKDGNKS
jgi:hypothetical protein